MPCFDFMHDRAANVVVCTGEPRPYLSVLVGQPPQDPYRDLHVIGWPPVVIGTPHLEVLRLHYRAKPGDETLLDRHLRGFLSGPADVKRPHKW